jgi:hypothetical protein
MARRLKFVSAVMTLLTFLPGSCGCAHVPAGQQCQQRHQQCQQSHHGCGKFEAGVQSKIGTEEDVALSALRLEARDALNAGTPSTLHPQPYTLNPTPSTLHPQPYTINCVGAPRCLLPIKLYRDSDSSLQIIPRTGAVPSIFNGNWTPFFKFKVGRARVQTIFQPETLDSKPETRNGSSKTPNPKACNPTPKTPGTSERPELRHTLPPVLGCCPTTKFTLSPNRRFTV